jgi:hypothetical protein
MSDTSDAYPPPPPPNVAPPDLQAASPNMPQYKLPPGYTLPPGYQGPTAPDYTQPYQSQQPINPGAAAAAGAGSILYQFGGPALYSILAGLGSIALPLFADRYFIVLPIFGALAGFRAIQRGRLLGGLAGIALNILGAIMSLFASGLVG